MLEFHTLLRRLNIPFSLEEAKRLIDQKYRAALVSLDFGSSGLLSRADDSDRSSPGARSILRTADSAYTYRLFRVYVPAPLVPRIRTPLAPGICTS